MDATSDFGDTLQRVMGKYPQNRSYSLAVEKTLEAPGLAF